VAGIASLVVALDGILVYFEADLLLECLLAPLGTLFALVLLRAGETGSARRWAVAGLVLGLFAVTRPNILLFAPVAAVLALGWRGEEFRLRRPRIAAAVALAVATCAVVLPVTWANVAVGGDRVLVASQAGLNFFLGNNPEANGWSATAPSLMRVDWWGGYEDSIRLAEEARGHELRPSEVSAYWFERAFDWWRGHPGAGLVVTLRKVVWFLSGLELANNRDIGLFLRDWAPVGLPSLALLYLVMPLAVAGAVSVWAGEGPRGKAIVLMMVVYAISVILFFVTARYRVPLRPLLVLLAVEGAWRLAAGLSRGSRRAAVGAAAVLALGVAVNANPWTAEYDPTPAQYFQSVANVYKDEGDLARAIEWQKKVLAAEPGYPDGNLNLGTMYMSAGDVEAAVRAFELERRLDPEDGRNLASLAAALARLGRVEEAERRYAEAEGAGLEDPPVLYNHGVLLERLGRSEEAEGVYRRAVAADSTFADGWNNLGVVLARTGRLEEAAECWERALRASPGHDRAASNLERARELLAGEEE
jgi:Tfp pilus assembly protein PilF